LQASKKIKNETALSKGTVSVSFAVVEWLKQQMDTARARILLIGAGSFGTTVVKNMKAYCPGAELSLSNRTSSKAVEICKRLEIQFVSFQLLPTVLNDFDVVICCTNAPAPFIEKSFFKPGTMRRIIDLSVPANVHAGVKELAGTRLVNLDEISGLVSSTLHQRLGEVPKANSIIEEHLGAFINWLGNYQHATAVAGFKHNLVTIKDKIPFNKVNGSVLNFTDGPEWEKGINDRAGQLMKKFKNYHNKGCQMILAYDNFIRSQMVLAGHD
jgi:glutamyl-tRNA reductase